MRLPEVIEIFSFLGAPARFFSRTLLLCRYLIDGYPALRVWCRGQNPYARTRFGPSYRWRIWLMFDVDELQRLERLINDGEDGDVVKFRDSQLESSRLVAVVGALLAQAAVSALSLPRIEQTHWGARMSFMVSLAISLLAIFFTCIQHRALGFLRRPIELRAWLSTGKRYEDMSGDVVFQSSLVGHQLLHAPYELVGISVTAFMGGLGTYLGSAWVRELEISVILGGSVNQANLGVFLPFLVGSVFACSMFGFLVGGKSIEMRDTVVRMEDLFHSRISRRAVLQRYERTNQELDEQDKLRSDKKSKDGIIEI